VFEASIRHTLTVFLQSINRLQARDAHAQGG
jgi:hypothetical protein